MVDVGNRVQLASRKVGHEPRTGVVTGVTGQVITVRWSSGEESRLVPGPGALTVVGAGTVTPRANKKANAAPKKAGPAKKKAGPAKKKAGPAKKKAVPATKKAGPAKKKAPPKR
jgi:hypothetical protein